MKKLSFTLLLSLLTTVSTFAHYLWIEVDPEAQLNQPVKIKIHYGEYTYGVIEKVEGDAFKLVDKFSVWVVDSDGQSTKLSLTPSEEYYVGHYTPKKEGAYTVLLDNNNIDVLDYTQYDFGIFKTHYHAVAQFQVGKSANDTATENENGLTIRRLVSENNEEVKLQVLYKNEAVSESEVAIYVADLWSKKLETDENGFISFKLPWPTKYIVEVTKKEEVPGHYNGKDYEFIWHCATYCIQPAL